MEEITTDKFYYYLEVLPPLVMGKTQVKRFLDVFDDNTKAIRIINLTGFNDLFIQGEGYDNHQIYGVTSDKKYYYIGDTVKKWDTSDFRYPDTGNDMLAKINRHIYNCPDFETVVV